MSCGVIALVGFSLNDELAMEKIKREPFSLLTLNIHQPSYTPSIYFLVPPPSLLPSFPPFLRSHLRLHPHQSESPKTHWLTTGDSKLSPPPRPHANTNHLSLHTFVSYNSNSAVPRFIVSVIFNHRSSWFSINSQKKVMANRRGSVMISDARLVEFPLLQRVSWNGHGTWQTVPAECTPGTHPPCSGTVESDILK